MLRWRERGASKWEYRRGEKGYAWKWGDRSVCWLQDWFNSAAVKLGGGERLRVRVGSGGRWRKREKGQKRVGRAIELRRSLLFVSKVDQGTRLPDTLTRPLRLVFKTHVGVASWHLPSSTFPVASSLSLSLSCNSSSFRPHLTAMEFETPRQSPPQPQTTAPRWIPERGRVLKNILKMAFSCCFPKQNRTRRHHRASASIIHPA